MSPLCHVLIHLWLLSNILNPSVSEICDKNMTCSLKHFEFLKSLFKPVSCTYILGKHCPKMIHSLAPLSHKGRYHGGYHAPHCWHADCYTLYCITNCFFPPMPLLYHLLSGVWAVTRATYCYEMHGRLNFQTVVITDVILCNFRKLS